MKKPLFKIYVKVQSYDQLIKAQLILDLYKIKNHEVLKIEKERSKYNFTHNNYYLFINSNGALGLKEDYPVIFNSFTEILFDQLIAEY